MGGRRDTRRSGGPIPWWRAELARRQMDVVRHRVELELTRKKLELNWRPAGLDEYDAVRQLELHHAALREARRDLDQIPTRKRRWRDRLVVWLWDWATQGKFEPPAAVR
jgi:hypothetical protein